MDVIPLEVDGGFMLVTPPAEDVRGSFDRVYDAGELAAVGIEFTVAETALSRNHRAGTLRGLHHQAPPHAEAKLVRCTRGEVYDVIVDVRRESPTYRRWSGVTLCDGDGTTLVVPAGCAHGFLALVDGAEVLYHLSVGHEPGSVRGVRWDDPGLAIPWPRSPIVLSERDRSFPDVAW
jgi:dTDP-4-dehydrorhamnose 3,5-epimerase